MLLVPLNLLFSIVFYTLVLEVALYIAWYAGYYTGIENMGFCGRNWCSPTPMDNLHCTSLPLTWVLHWGYSL
ncbi:MAG: hypothetical protein QXL27_07550 [Candidatus Bathyarchaeia archaeon]